MNYDHYRHVVVPEMQKRNLRERMRGRFRVDLRGPPRKRVALLFPLLLDPLFASGRQHDAGGDCIANSADALLLLFLGNYVGNPALLRC